MRQDRRTRVGSTRTRRPEMPLLLPVYPAATTALIPRSGISPALVPSPAPSKRPPTRPPRRVLRTKPAPSAALRSRAPPCPWLHPGAASGPPRQGPNSGGRDSLRGFAAARPEQDHPARRGRGVPAASHPRRCPRALRRPLPRRPTPADRGAVAFRGIPVTEPLRWLMVTGIRRLCDSLDEAELAGASQRAPAPRAVRIAGAQVSAAAWRSAADAPLTWGQRRARLRGEEPPWAPP